MMERLQKVLARAGIASRRKCEELITAGRVTVGGEVVTELGYRVDSATKTIAVDGTLISIERIVNVILHKPTSYVTTVSDPQGRRTVMDLFPEFPQRIFPVGRLDYDTSGLLLMSNDGELTHKLLHPGHRVNKIYRVTCLGMPEKAALQQLRSGVRLEDGMTQPAKVSTLRMHPLESVFEITIHEGRNRQIRRMFETVGHPVKRLKRVAFDVLVLGDLHTGEWRALTPQEWKDLYTSVGLTPPPYDGLSASGNNTKSGSGEGARDSRSRSKSTQKKTASNSTRRKNR